MPPATALDSSHHTFLQAVMRRGPLSEKTAMGMYKSLVKSNGDGFGEFLLAINKELEFIRLELKKVMNQYDGKVFYGIINSLPSKEAKLGTQFSQAQIIFFTAVVEAIVQDPSASGVISSIAAMNLKLEAQAPGSESPDANTQTGPIKMPMPAREDAISLLAAEQFLSRTESGGVALGVKAFLELRSVFRNLEVPFCDICNEAAIKAQLCSTADCPKRVHVYCIARGSSQSRNQRPKCSGCKTVWEQTVEEVKGGPQDGTDEEEYTVAIATQEEPVHVSSKRKAPRRKRSTAVLDDDEGEEDVPTKRRASRRKRSAVLDDDEEEEDEHVEEEHESDEEQEVVSTRSTRSSRRSAR